MDQPDGRTHCGGYPQKLAGAAFGRRLWGPGTVYHRADLPLSDLFGISLSGLRFDALLCLYTDGQVERGCTMEYHRISMVAISVRIVSFSVCLGKENAVADTTAYRSLHCYPDLVGTSVADRVISTL